MKAFHSRLWLWLALPGIAAWASETSNPPPTVFYQAPAQAVSTPASPAPPAPAPAPAAPAQSIAPAQPASAWPVPAKLNSAELEKLVAPIALYPDPLVAAVLPASAYPIEVALAARFVKDTNNLARLDQQPWDESVKTVARFPEVIQKMNNDLPWSIDLGQAFVVQPKDVMDTIQTMRGRAQAAGTLQTTPQQTVSVSDQVVVQSAAPEVIYVTNQVIQIQPAQPEVIYVPQYDPAVVYAPLPSYYYYHPYVPLVTFGIGVWFGYAYWGDCDWHHGWVGRPPHYPYHYAGHYGRGGGDPRPGGGGPPPPGGRGGGGLHSGGPPPGGPSRPWQPDANRLMASGTRGSQATMVARDPAGWRAATGNSSVRPVPSVPINGRSSSGQFGAVSRPAQVGGGPRLSPTGSMPGPASAAGPRGGFAASPPSGSSPAAVASRPGGRAISAPAPSRSGAIGPSISRPMGSSSYSRPSAAPSISRSPTRSFAPSAPSIGTRSGSAGVRGTGSAGGFRGPAAPQGFGGSRSIGSSSSMGGRISPGISRGGGPSMGGGFRGGGRR